MNKKCPLCEENLLYDEESIINFQNFNFHVRCFDEVKQWMRNTSNMQRFNQEYKESFFKELQILKGEEGARKIFRSHSRAVKMIESEDVLDDMDSPEAYEQLLAQYIK